MTDFVMDFPADRPIRILQLTDMQTIDLSATRNPTRDRQIKGAYFKDGEPEMESRVYREVRALVGRVKPDLIVLTGDNVYGEFDDTGRLQRELVELMDSFGKSQLSKADVKLLQTAQNNAYREAIAQWVADAKVDYTAEGQAIVDAASAITQAE